MTSFRHEEADRALTIEVTADGGVQIDVTEWVTTSWRRVPVTATITVPLDELLEDLLRMAVMVIGSDEIEAAAAALGVREVTG